MSGGSPLLVDLKINGLLVILIGYRETTMSEFPGENDSSIGKRLKIPGRLLLISTIVGAPGLLLWYFWDRPVDRYPILLVLVPVVLAGFAFFKLSVLLLEKCGVRIYHKSSI
jgi:hypothetical protein